MPNSTYDLFIAAPMSALDTAGYAEGRAEVLALMDRLSAVHGFKRIYFAGAAISGPEAFTAGADALHRDVEGLRSSRLFTLLYPTKIVTSALVEVGYALALQLPCLLLVRDESDLPYLLRQAEKREAGDMLPPVKIAIYREPEHAARTIAEFRDKFLLTEHTRGQR